MQQKPCKPGKVRIDGRCRKPPTGKPPCKPGKVRNPAGRCVKAKPAAKPPCKPGKVRNPAGRCVKAKSAQKPVAKKPSPKAPSPFKRLPGMTIKQTCKATAVNKCRSPCSVIRLPNGKQMCTQVKKPAKLPTKRTMYALARMA